jgi:lysophospholipase L1-like esterase
VARFSLRKNFRDALIIALVSFIIFVLIDFFAGSSLLAYAKNEGKKDPFRIPNAPYHHALQANYAGPAYWGPFDYWVCTNASAMKSPCSDKNSTEKNFDIAFIGDSFTEGVGVNYEDSFVGMVAKAHPELKIANLGVVSYSPTIYLKKLEDYLNRGYTFKKVIVFVDIGDIMDEAFYFENSSGNVQLTSEIIHPGVVPWLKRTFKKNLPLTYETIHYAKKGWLEVTQSGKPSLIATATTVEKPLPTTSSLAITAAEPPAEPPKQSVDSIVLNAAPAQHPQPSAEKLPLPIEEKKKSKNVWIYDREYTRSAWTYNLNSPGYGDLGVQKSIEKAAHQMERVAALLEKNNIKLSVGVYPWPAQLKFDQVNSLQVQLWKKFCETRCENFYDTFPAFFNAVQTLGIDATIYKYYFQGDMHFNREGNALVAETILRTTLTTP